MAPDAVARGGDGAGGWRRPPDLGVEARRTPAAGAQGRGRWDGVPALLAFLRARAGETGWEGRRWFGFVRKQIHMLPKCLAMSSTDTINPDRSFCVRDGLLNIKPEYHS